MQVALNFNERHFEQRTKQRGVRHDRIGGLYPSNRPNSLVLGD